MLSSLTFLFFVIISAFFWFLGKLIRSSFDDIHTKKLFSYVGEVVIQVAINVYVHFPCISVLLYTCLKVFKFSKKPCVWYIFYKVLILVFQYKPEHFKTNRQQNFTKLCLACVVKNFALHRNILFRSFFALIIWVEDKILSTLEKNIHPQQISD